MSLSCRVTRVSSAIMYKLVAIVRWGVVLTDDKPSIIIINTPPLEGCLILHYIGSLFYSTCGKQ